MLSLDADYELSPALVEELKSLWPADTVAGFRSAFVYRIYGRPLRGSLYPPRTVLYRVKSGQYANEGHGHRVRITGGDVATLRDPIYHDDRKPLSRWLQSQLKYAARESAHLLAMPRNEMSRADRVRAIGLAGADPGLSLRAPGQGRGRSTGRPAGTMPSSGCSPRCCSHWNCSISD